MKFLLLLLLLLDVLLLVLLEFFDILLPLAGSPGSPYYPFFDFVVEGKKRILINDLDNIVSFDPIIDTTKNRIDFTSTIGEKFYIQTHTGATNGGKLKVHGSDRYPLSTFDLNGASVSGIGIDYTYEDGEFKVLSFSQDLTGNTIVDKFNTVNGRSEGTTYLNVSSNEPYSLCAFKAETAFDLTSTNPPRVGFCEAFDVPFEEVKLKAAEDESEIAPENLAASIRLPLTKEPKLTMLFGSNEATVIIRSFMPSAPPIAEPKIVTVSPTL